MTKIELIVFDMGGVLSLADEQIPIRRLMELSGKTEAAVFDACFSIERKRPLETGRQSWEEFAEQSRRLLGLAITNDEFRHVYDSWHLRPNTELCELIERLDGRYRIGVCSNTGPTHWELQRNRLPYFDRFDPVILSYEVGAMKPTREIYEILVDRSDIPHERILFTDDLIGNVEAARDAGLNVVHFTSVEQFKEHLARNGIEP